jgi:colanic acid/amylovoran biosynthesis protein
MDEEATHRPLRVLLVNLHSSWNAGDDALTQEALRQLKRKFPLASFTLAMNDPSSYRGQEQTLGSFTTWVKPIVTDQAASHWQWKAFPGLMAHSLLAIAGFRLTGQPWYPFLDPERQGLLQAYLQADMVVSAAGNFLYSSGKIGLPFLLALFAIFYARLAGKAIYTLPQTLGPIHRRRERFLARSVLSKARLVLIRDPISVGVWKTWAVQGPQWTLLPDLAFARPAEPDRQEALALLRDYEIQEGRHRPWLGVTLIHWSAQSRSFGRQERYEDAVEAAIRDFLANCHGQVVLFAQVQGPSSAEDDRIPARRVLAQLEDVGEHVALVDRWVPPHVLKAAYGQMDLFLGTRLHSNIFALTEGVPAVAIGYQYKTRGVMRMLDLEDWVLDIEQVDRETLVCLLNRAWLERKRTRTHIQQVLPTLRLQASTAGDLIATDFCQLRALDRGR